MITPLQQRLIELKGGLSYAAFAEKCGLTESGVRKYFPPLSSEPTLSKVIAIASSCGASLEWLATGDKTFTRHQARNLIQMAEAFQAVARSYPEKEFPWGAVAFRPEWFMDEALPVLERTAALAGVGAGGPWFTAIAGSFSAAIARWSQQYGPLPHREVLNELARNAVGGSEGANHA